MVYLETEQIDALDAGGLQYKRHSGIEFKITEVQDNSITIKTVQKKHLSENYLSQKELADRTKSLFGRFLPNSTIHVHATPYEEHHISKIDRNWVNKQMMELGIKAKEIERETGIIKTSLSAWLSDTTAKPMSQITKAFFYYYFLSKR